MRYSIVKLNIVTEEKRDYGHGFSEQDVKDLTKGFKFNGLFYERKNSNWIIDVTEENENLYEKIHNLLASAGV